VYFRRAGKIPRSFYIEKLIINQRWISLKLNLYPDEKYTFFSAFNYTGFFFLMPFRSQIKYGSID